MKTVFSDHLPKCAILFNGNDKSPCPLPCITFKIKKKIISSSSVRNKEDPDEGRIRLLFSSNVQVSRTDFIKPTLTRFEIMAQMQVFHQSPIIKPLLTSDFPQPASWQRLGAQWVFGSGWGWSRLFRFLSLVSNGLRDPEMILLKNRQRQ